MRLLLALAVVAAALAGCFAGDPDRDGAAGRSWSEAALPFGGGHDHANASHHAGLSTPNFRILGHDPLLSPHYGAPAGGYLCGDAKQTPDGRRLAVVESRSDVAFAIADVTDPADPRWLGELVIETDETYVYDLAVTPDGAHAVLVTSEGASLSDAIDRVSDVTPTALTHGGAGEAAPGATDADAAVPAASAASQHAQEQQAAGTTPRRGSAGAGDPDGHGAAGAAASGLTWHSPCADGPVPLDAQDPLPRPLSLLLVDISEPAEPAIVDQRLLSGLGHSAFTTAIDGETWILVSNVATDPVRDTFQLYKLLETPGGTRLELMSTYAAERPERLGRTGIGGHTDGWIQEYPATGTPLGYLVGSMGLHIVDLSDPRAPEQVAAWTDDVAGRSGPVGNLHSAFPLPELHAGRHLTIIGPEFHSHPDEHPSGIVWVLDTTDPAAPREVAAWTLPHEVEWNGTYMFSNHYLAAVGQTAFVSMYHGGVWALDLSAIGPEPGHLTLLPSIGVFLPTNETVQAAEPVRWTPTLEEVLAMPDGSLVTFDSNTGLYTFRFDADRPMPAPEPWPVAPL